MRMIQNHGQGGGQKRVLLQPDLTILFDLPSEVAQARRSAARDPDKFEQLNSSFFEQVRQEYLRRAQDDPGRFEIIDANQSKEHIWNLLQNILLNI